MTKYLIMVILMTSINIPLFIYSRSFLKPEHAGMETIDMHGAPAQSPAQSLLDVATPNTEDKPTLQESPAADSAGRQSRTRAFGEFVPPATSRKMQKTV